MQGVGGALACSEPKTARSRRTVPLPPVTLAALRAHRAAQVSARLKVRTAHIATTLNTYAHVPPVLPRQAAERMDDLLSTVGDASNCCQNCRQTHQPQTARTAQSL